MGFFDRLKFFKIKTLTIFAIFSVYFWRLRELIEMLRKLRNAQLLLATTKRETWQQKVRISFWNNFINKIENSQNRLQETAGKIFLAFS